MSRGEASTGLMEPILEYFPLSYPVLLDFPLLNLIIPSRLILFPKPQPHIGVGLILLMSEIQGSRLLSKVRFLKTTLAVVLWEALPYNLTMHFTLNTHSQIAANL